MDTLMKDYPSILTKNLNYDIYIDDIDFADPSGVAFSGINKYKGFFSLIRFLCRTVFTPLEVSSRVTWDGFEQQVKVRWTVKLTINTLGRLAPPIEIEGMSAYHLNWAGWVYMHEI